MERSVELAASSTPKSESNSAQHVVYVQPTAHTIDHGKLGHEEKSIEQVFWVSYMSMII